MNILQRIKRLFSKKPKQIMVVHKGVTMPMEQAVDLISKLF